MHPLSRRRTAMVPCSDDDPSVALPISSDNKAADHDIIVGPHKSACADVCKLRIRRQAAVIDLGQARCRSLRYFRGRSPYIAPAEA